MLTTIQPPAGRGCGDRDEGVPYLCCGVSFIGMPIEHFIVDPVIPWPGKFQRGIKILPRNPENPDGVQDVVIFVGKKYYASAWCYVEETRRYGASRKVPPSLPFEKLTPGESRMVFVHSQAIPKFDYELNREPEPLLGCKYFQRWVDNKEVYNDEPPERHIENTLCTFGLRDLSFLVHVHGDIVPNDEDSEYYRVIMPSFEYSARWPNFPHYMSTKGKWKPGIFLALNLTHIEFCRKADPKTKEKIEQVGFETATLEW